MKHCVLIVDDNDELRELLAFAFRRGGFEVATARDGAEGGRASLERRFDLIVTDIVMPARDGLGLISEILGRDPAAKIIAISGGGAPNGCHLTAARALGVREVLRKPFLPGEILVAARRLLEGGPGRLDFALLDDAPSGAR
jgi:DNA-binding response OmpR family regulator